MDVKLFIEVQHGGVQLRTVLLCYEFHRGRAIYRRLDHPAWLWGLDEKTPATRIFASLRIFFSLPSLLRFCSALRRAGAAPEGSEGYPSELRAAVHSRRAGNNLGYAMLPRLFPLYRLFIFFVMDELKSAHLFRLADFYFIVIFLEIIVIFFLEIIVVETLPFNTPSNRLGLLL